MTANTTQHTITNDDFIREAFKNITPEEQVWVLSKPVVEDNNWKGGPLLTEAPTGKMNNYTSPAAMRMGTSRLETNHSSTHFVVLDDADLESLPLQPSYIIETSKGSTQVGYFLEQPEESLARVAALMSVLSAKDNPLSDSSGNNPVRVVRLPQGRNTKKDYETQMLEWNPERRYSFAEVEQALRVAVAGDSTEITVDDFMSSDDKFKKCLEAIVDGRDFHDSINVAAARLVSKGCAPGDAVAMLQTIMHTSPVKQTDFTRWRERYDDIERSVGTALKKYGPDSVVTSDTTKLVTVDYSIDKLEEIEWVVDGFISTGITIIAGAPGVGKTSKICALTMLAAHLCHFDEPLRPFLRRRVVYITEDALQIKRAIHAANRLLDLDIGQDEYNEWFEIKNAARLSPEDLEREVRTLVRSHTVSGPNGYRVRPLIVLDTSNATLDMEDENSNSEAGAFVSRLKKAAGGCPLWLVAHTSKAMGRADTKGLSARGASAFEGDANAVAYVFMEEDAPEYRFMRLGKHRYEAECLELRFTTELYEKAITTSWGASQTVQTRVSTPELSSYEQREMIVEHGREKKKAERTDSVLQRIKDDILEALANGPLTKNQIVGRVTGQTQRIHDAILELELGGLIEIRRVKGNKLEVDLVPQDL